MAGFKADHKAVLVTGAGSGIGAVTASMLSGMGFQVFAGLRVFPDGAGGHGADREPIPIALDVTDEAAIARGAETVAAALAGSGRRLWGIVNNAAVGHAGPLEIVPLALIRQEMNVAALGALAVTRAFLPQLRAGGGGRIVNVSSLHGYCPAPSAGGYAGAKFVRPGGVDTPMWGKLIANFEAMRSRIPAAERSLYHPDWDAAVDCVRDDTRKYGSAGVPAEKVARTVIRGLTARRPRTRYTVGWDARLLSLARAYLPDRAYDRLVRRAYSDQAPDPRCGLPSGTGEETV